MRIPDQDVEEGSSFPDASTESPVQTSPESTGVTDCMLLFFQRMSLMPGKMLKSPGNIHM